MSLALAWDVALPVRVRVTTVSLVRVKLAVQTGGDIRGPHLAARDHVGCEGITGQGESEAVADGAIVGAGFAEGGAAVGQRRGYGQT